MGLRCLLAAHVLRCLSLAWNFTNSLVQKFSPKDMVNGTFVLLVEMSPPYPGYHYPITVSPYWPFFSLLTS